MLIDALRDGKQQTRQAAAEWLMKYQITEAIPSLLAAVKKENGETVKATMFNALQTLGVSLGEMIDRQGMSKEAERYLQKGIPPALDWFPFDRLPAVHWSDTGEPVTPSIITWWLVVSVKVGDPAQNALLRCYAEAMRPAEREALARFVMEAWIAYDTLPKYTPEEAAMEARLQARQTVQLYQQYPQIKPDNWTEEQGCATSYRLLLRECKGSAIKEKGMLALVSACGGDEIVTLAHRYLQEWYGQRVHQCRALVRMLSAIDRHAATQLLLAVATRFRTKSIQQEAEHCVQALAERHHWTVEELGDRTIPTAGFDDGPEMVLEYGKRRFIARLTDAGAIQLFDETGTSLKELPDARKDEDTALVKDAKARLTAAKKAVKQIASTQTARLYEAMCTQRNWRYEDWQAFLHDHPVMRLLCQRLVWQVEGQPAHTFRPLNDGTLSDIHDDEVTLYADDIIRVAHSCTIPGDASGYWLRHFADYEVRPLFDQFSRPRYTLPDTLREETEITEFQGYLLEAFKLRGKATAFGYLRGQGEDGGWFYSYTRRFTGLQLNATIEFSGNRLLEENRLVALKTLSFSTINEEHGSLYSAESIPLGEIPPVLLSECWNDLRLLAAQGDGFDAEWESKVDG